MGWSDLVKNYKMEEPKRDLKRIGFISAAINSANYNNAIVAYQNKKGLFLKTVLVFRLFHPQVFIPWEEIKEVRTKKILFFTVKELIVGQPFVATIKIKNGVFKKLNIPEEKNVV